MKMKFFLLVIFILVAIVSVFVYFNPTQVPLYFPPAFKFTLPVSLVILSAIIVGFGAMFFLALFREIKISLENRKLRKILKNKEKSLQTFEKGLKEKFYGNFKNAYKNILNAVKLDNNFIYQIFLKDLEENNEKREEIINKLPFDLSKFYLLQYYFQNKKYGTIVNIAKDIINDNSFKNLEIFEIVRDSYTNLEKYKEAYEIEEKILSLKNIDKVTHVKKLAELKYLDVKKDYTDNKFDVLKKKFNTFRPLYFLKFLKLKENNELFEAVKILKEGYKNCNDPIFLCELTKISIESNNDKLIKEVEKILSKFKSKESKLLKALILFHENKLDDAENIVKQYLENSDISKFALLIYAEILYRKNMDIKDVIENFRKVLNTQEGICLKFRCSNCNTIIDDWIDYCPNCNSFDSLTCSFKKGV